MIDFHTHIIPNIDDGSKSVEETFNLLKEAKEAGFDEVISTSHYMEKYYEASEEERKVWIESIQKVLMQKGIDIKMHLGNEIYLSNNIIDLLKEHKASTIGGTNYVLFEMPLNEKPLNLYDMIYEMQEYKLVPILAHPERYSFVKTEPDLIYDLIEKGVLMQANYASILGGYGQRAQIIVRKLLECNMIHFLGTDVHKQEGIYPKVPDAIKEIKKIIGEDMLYKLTTLNAKNVLENKEIDIETPKQIKLTFGEKIELRMNN